MTTRAPNALRVVVVYYSARGNVHGLARAVAEGAASVRRRGSFTRTSVVRGIFRKTAEARAEASSCPQLPDDPASARATARSD